MFGQRRLTDKGFNLCYIFCSRSGKKNGGGVVSFVSGWMVYPNGETYLDTDNVYKTTEKHVGIKIEDLELCD